MSTIRNLNRAAKQYCEEIASIDIQSDAINGSMKTICSYQDLKAAFVAGAKWYKDQLDFPEEIQVERTTQRRTKYCDECVHFVPAPCDDPDNISKDDFSDLCEFKKNLKFKFPPRDDLMSYDYGFYCPGCEDWKDVNKEN